MIPLSNGRSPRVDQYYATLRTIMHDQPDHHNFRRFDQDRSIQRIRSLGKEIFDNPFPHRKRTLQKEMVIGLNKSSEALYKQPSLYQKYKQRANTKAVKQITHVKQIIKKQQLTQTPEKFVKNKKYQNVPSKIQVKTTIKGLNYAKRADIQAQKQKKQKIQCEKFTKQLKQKQSFYERSNKNSYLNTSREITSTGLLKRGQQLQQRKQKKVQKIRSEQIEKQMSASTFQPKMTSRKISTVQSNYNKRNEISLLNKLSKQKDIINQTVLSSRFTPQTNGYKEASSKVAKFWKQPKFNSKYDRYDSYFDNHSYSLQKIGEESGQIQFKSQKTANSTTHVNLKNMNQLSFIFQ